MLKLVWQNLQYSVRILWKSPSFTVVAIITLAIGIGANATIFSFINGLLLRPIAGVEQPDRLIAIYTSDYSSGAYSSSSYPDYLDFRHQSSVFTDLAAYDSDSFTIAGENPEQLTIGLVTTNYFQVLGVRAEIGRTLRAEDDAPGTPNTAVLSHSFWKRYFGGDVSVIGRSITLDEKPYTIVGVAAQNFQGLRLTLRPDVWLPLIDKYKDMERGNRGIGITGRLSDNVSVQQAQAQITTISDRLARAYPETNMGTLTEPNLPRPVTVVPEARFSPTMQSNLRRLTLLLFVVVGIVLLIACANVANLFLARASSRRREFAIRLALGASRWKLVEQLLIENVLLAIVSGATGLIVALWTADFIPAFFLPGDTAALDLSLDWRVLLFTTIVSILTGILFGLAPAIQSSRPRLVSILKDEKKVSISSVKRRLGLRGLFVAAQVALCVLLLVGAGLFLRSLRNAVTFDPGFDNKNLLLTRLIVGRTLTKSQLEAFFRDVTDNLASETGVRSVSLTKVTPLSGGGQRRGIIIEGYNPRPNEDIELNTNVVGVNFFNTMGIPFVKGRDFNSGDRAGAPGVVIVNDEFARRYFSEADAVGKRVRTDSKRPPLEIVGVVRTAKHRDLRETALPIVYIPLAQEMQGNMTLVVRTSDDPAKIRANVRSVVHRVNPNIPMTSPVTITEQINLALAFDRTLALLLGIFGATALLLAAVGIYGVVAYSVEQRRHEIGIRMALGAQSANVLRVVISEGMFMAIAGVVVGLGVALILTRLVTSLLFGVTSTDVPTFTIVSVGLLMVAFIACYVPARRATNVDPLVALRYE
jgi:putative ABC transport system permease protein